MINCDRESAGSFHQSDITGLPIPGAIFISLVCGGSETRLTDSFCTECRLWRTACVCSFTATPRLAPRFRLAPSTPTVSQSQSPTTCPPTGVTRASSTPSTTDTRTCNWAEKLGLRIIRPGGRFSTVGGRGVELYGQRRRASQSILCAAGIFLQPNCRALKPGVCLMKENSRGALSEGSFPSKRFQ